MDALRFDSVARRLATRSTRRETVRAVLAGSLGLVAGGAVAIDAAAKKKKLGDKCSGNDQCGKGLTCKRANSQNSCYQKTEKRCCKPTGAHCEDSCDCCGVDVICNGGFCQNA